MVHVKPTNKNKDFQDINGAYVNVACLAESEQSFMEKVRFTFQHNGFDVVEIEDIETENKLIVMNLETSEKAMLISSLTDGVEFAWGNFHTYDSEEE